MRCRSCAPAPIGRLLVAGLALCAAFCRPAWAAKPEVAIEKVALPSSALAAVTNSVDTIATMADDQDGGESARLQRRAREAAQTALATEGYFSAQVELSAQESDGGAPVWRLTIVPGERTTIAAVDLEFRGAITGEVFADRVAQLREGWRLKAGQPFRNDEWESAKRDLVDEAGEHDFPAARLVESAADVDAGQARATLHVVLDSGPAVRLGQVQVHGLKRVPAGVAERYLRIDPGEPYDRSRMVDRQQALSRSPFFAGAKLDVDRTRISPHPNDQPGLMPPDMQETGAEQAYVGPSELTLPVLADVVESRPQRMSVALGVDDEAGPRGETVYRRNVIFNLPVELETGIHLDRLRQLGYADLHLAPNAGGFLDSVGVLAENSDIQGLGVRQLALGAIRTKTYPAGGGSRVEYETRYGARVAYELLAVDGGATYNASAATVTTEVIRRDINNKYDPRDGTLFSVGAGAGNTLDGSNPFARLTARAQYWWSPTSRDVLTVRGEIGQLWTHDINRVPDDFSFRTGGARSVRGYSYLSLGRHVANAVLGDATLFVASIEGTHYLNDRYGVAVFVDTGNVASSFDRMRLVTGVGTGVRVRTPAGPLSVDIAYALHDNTARLNFSLGIAF